MTTTPISRHYRIRIGPAVGDAPIAVHGAIYGGDDGAMTLFDGLTPLDVEASGSVLSGMVQAVDRDTHVRVDVFAAAADEEPHCVMGAKAHTVLLGDNLLRGTSTFIRGAP